MAHLFPGRRRFAVAALATATLVLGACASTGADTTPGASTPDVAGAFPLSLDNCGTQVTVTAPPERIVTVKSSTTEMVLALGAGERLVGTAFADGPLPGALTQAPGADAPVLAERVPSYEVVLAAEPDLVYAGWESAFSPDGVGERSTLADLGIATYVPPAACRDAALQPDPLTFDDVFAQIAEAGALLGRADAAADLVAEQRAALAAVEPSDRGLTALWYSSGSDTPFVGAGIGAPQMIMAAAGLTNVVADVEDTWASVSWEAVVDREPDVVVLVDSSWNTAENKKGILAANPATSALPAVQEERYVVVPFPATEAGIRNVDAVVSIVEQLAELDLP